MANYMVTGTQLTSIADAIREKGGTNNNLSFPDGYVSAIQAIPTGGGGSSGDASGQVKFIDYDGTIVASKTKAEINAMTSDSDLPSNPTHTGLTAQGWNWTLAQIKAQLTAIPDGEIYVGQMYVTTSGDTEIDVEFVDSARLSPILTIAVNGTITVDWGDNTTPDTVTGTSLTSRKAVGPHNYASTGSYTIKIGASTGNTYSFYGTSAYTLLRKNTTDNQNRVYSNCIKNVRIGNGITSIGSSAFQNCYSLASITIPSGITSIESSAFQNCYPLASVTIPSNVTTIKNYAFQNCYALASVTIPNSVTSIGNSVFQNCYSLVSVIIPSGVTSIGNSAFYYCSSLASVTIPSSVTSIETYAFYNCYALTSITIPSLVTSIGDYVFYSCYSLARVTIPSDVTSIGTYAFYNCYALASITIPSNVTSIKNGAFQNCYSLASVTIPSNVTSIGNSVFSNCYGAAKYHIQPATVPTAGTTIFNNIVSDCIIYVPQGKLNDYQTASNWSTYASYMQEEPT